VQIPAVYHSGRRGSAGGSRGALLSPAGCRAVQRLRPAEATIYASGYACRRGQDERIIPIGRPIANTEIYILDRHLQPVPIGVQVSYRSAGWVWLVAISTTRTLRPEVHPASVPSGQSARIYKTGDLARYRPDGNIDFLGRSDHQVKIRGQRIELGRWRRCLPSTRGKAGGCHTMATHSGGQGPGGIRRSAQGQQASRSDLRAFLSAKLPDYMVPSDWVFLDVMPSTASGKTNRAALPPPTAEAPPPALAARHPATSSRPS